MKADKKRKAIRKNRLSVLLLAAVLVFSSCSGGKDGISTENNRYNGWQGEQSRTVSAGMAGIPQEENSVSDFAEWLETLPDYTGEAGIDINNGIPFFTEDEITTEAFEIYSRLDELGRCGVAFANICQELMPTEKRESISSVRPTGWHSVEYDVISDRYLYNRCHLIGFQLAGENANKENLITGTRYLNVEGMLPWENLVAEYVEITGNHVLYRVTPYFEGENLVASGVEMEGLSVEDGGAGVCFNVYCYNIQPGISIDYATGESTLDKSWPGIEYNYVLNINSKKFHLPTCPSVKTMNEKNREYYDGKREDLTEAGYTPCLRCNP